MSSCPAINPFCEEEEGVNSNSTPHLQTPEYLRRQGSSYTEAGGKSTPPPKGHPSWLNLPNNSTPNESPLITADMRLPTHDSIARFLLEEHFLLTALEFYAELVENGRECKRLRDFFSNPANFDFRSNLGCRFDSSPIVGLARASSAQTLDSLDYCHYSDDGKQNDEKLAVLEFELRKANDTIKELREQLTAATTSTSESINFLGNGSKYDEGDRKVHNLQSHEKKAINFLINEYLMENGYKLTSVCLTDEAADQDFDHWDDVGLNISRPNDLLSLFRQHINHPQFVNEKRPDLQDFACQTSIDEDLYDSTSLKADKIELSKRNQILEKEIERLNLEMDRLHQLVSNLDTEIKDSSPALMEATKPANKLAMTLADGWKSERKVPKPFRRLLFESVNGYIGIDNIHTQKSLIAVTGDDLINLLSEILPSIISNAPTNKREDFVPLILSLASLHSDLRERDKMLDAFFRLFKKLDEEQRSTLVHGCVSYARHVGHVRTESELLPQLWEQISDKSVERRLLIVEICGALVPYVPPNLISSLLLSILTQLLDDNSDQVKEGAVKSLALVCAYIEDQDKFQSILNLMLKALNDTSELVVYAATTLMATSLGLWALELNKLHIMVKQLLQLTDRVITVKSADENVAKILVGCLKQLNCIIFVDVIKSAPFYSGGLADQSTRFGHDCPPFTIESFENPCIFFDNDEEYSNYKRQFDDYISQEWYLAWSSLEFIYKELVPSVVKLLCNLDCSSFRQLPHNYVTYFRNLTILFGRTFTMTKIQNAFLDLCPSLRLLSSDSSEQNLKTHVALTDIVHAVLPVYVVGILTEGLEGKDRIAALKVFIKNAALVVGDCELDSSSLIMTFEMLSSFVLYHEVCLSIVYELLTHQSLNIRKLCAVILTKLCKKIDDTNMKSRALSALITLGSDSSKVVKMATLPCLVEFIEYETYSIECDEKLRMQFSVYFDNSHSEVDASTETTIQLLRLLAQTAPYIDANFRDDYILPQIAIIVARNNLCQNQDLKTMMTASLFECYSAMSCCPSLSANSIRVHFLPGLKNLQKDLDNERFQVANSILKDLELKIIAGQVQQAAGAAYGKAGNSLSIANETVDVVKSRMFSKFKDFKDKMDMHKESVPKIFGVKK